MDVSVMYGSRSVEMVSALAGSRPPRSQLFEARGMGELYPNGSSLSLRPPLFSASGLSVMVETPSPDEG